MIGIDTILSLPWYLELIIAMVALFWMARDITKHEMGSKYRWTWTIILVVAYFFEGAIGVGIGLGAYLVWSRAFYLR